MAKGKSGSVFTGFALDSPKVVPLESHVKKLNCPKLSEEQNL